MTWICLEGLDRSGKSTVAEHYKKMGYQIVHMSAPDKKYFKPGYNGESYLEEMVNLYSNLEGKKVLFDRTVYGECIWPQVYGRPPMLSEEDLEYLAAIERNNGIERILMYDENVEAHWQRCLANNEPLTRQQFGRANIFYDRLVKDYGFVKRQLTDFPGLSDNLPKAEPVKPITESPNIETMQNTTETETIEMKDTSSVEDKLERANAIRTLLQTSVLKKKGGAYDSLESTVRDFLQKQMDELFEPPKKTSNLTEEEISILKLYVARIKESMKK